MRITIGLLLCLLGPEDACLPLAEWLEIINLTPPRPPVHEMPLWVLNYWPFTLDQEVGNWVIMDGWNVQCNASCNHFSNGIETRLVWQDKSAACPSEWVGIWPHDTAVVHIAHYGSFVCNDEFGDISFQEPMYSDYHGQWVIPVDRFSPYWSSQLIYDWRLTSRAVSENPLQ